MHPDRHGRRARAARGSLAATIATTTAATAHTLSGGGAPPPWLVLAVTVLAAPLAVWLVGRALSVWRTAAVVALSQALLHAAFTAVGSPSMAAGFAASGAPHAHDSLLLSALASPAATHAIDPPMLFGHLVAAAVTVALLVHGERLARALGRGIRRLLAPVIGHIAFPRTPRLHTLARRRALSARPFHTTLSRRGPPALVR